MMQMEGRLRADPGANPYREGHSRRECTYLRPLEAPRRLTLLEQNATLWGRAAASGAVFHRPPMPATGVVPATHSADSERGDAHRWGPRQWRTYLDADTPGM